jgi:predicted ABC-type ATPase
MKDCLKNGESFTFETVLSSPHKLNFLTSAKDKGYFLKGYFVFTTNPLLNLSRVEARVENGGHGVPEDKILKRWHNSIANLPRIIELCDVIHVFDNSSDLGNVPYVRIFKKRKDNTYNYCNCIWSNEKINKLTQEGKVYR